MAVVYEGQELSYQQLNERANQLAHLLRDLGVKPDTLVGIAVERSLEMIVGLLGILKAGGTYVPLDPTYPDERLRFMLKDTGTSLLITQAHLRESFRDYSGTLLILELTGEEKELSVEEWSFNSENGSTQKRVSFTENASQNLEALAKADNLAYVIYTSGSTGKPKGVMIGHRGIARLIKNTNYIDIIPSDKVAHAASLSFDAATFEIWGALLNGAELSLISQKESLNIDHWNSFITKNKLSILWLTARLFDQISCQTSISFSLLRYLIVGGEKLNSLTVRSVLNKEQPQYFLNGYGPTEGTTFSLTYKVPHNWNALDIPLGRPIANGQSYILNDQLMPVPIGITGEIYIGGMGLARGYLNQPDLTAEKFVPNPFVREDVDPSSLRLYRTGDLARYLPDGNIEFLGRIDDQVKVRGFRIELGEIESVLQNHEDVAQAVVTVIEDETEQLSNKKLVAYVVPSQSIAPSLTLIDKPLVSSAGESFSLLEGEEILSMTERLRNHLLPSLPDYMIPSFFVYIDKIPLTPNGKVDRKALPAPDPALRQTEDEYVAPRTATEQELCAIWQEVLKVEKVGIHDNFFRIGGDSIISIQMVSKARLRGIHFTVKDIFNNPTIASLAPLAKTQEGNLTFKPDQNTITGSIPLTPIQHWFFEYYTQDPNHFNQAMMLQSFQNLSPSLLNQVFSHLLSHHDALRSRYHQDNQGNWIQTCLGEEKAFSVQEMNLAHLSSDAQLAQGIEDLSSLAQQTFNLETGPLIQAVLFNCGPSRPQRLLIVIHHLVVDGISWRVLLEDIERLYAQLVRQEAPLFPPKTHSYQQWATALQEYASSQSLKEEIPYWQETLKSVKPLPVDFDQGLALGKSFRIVSISLTKEETSLLLHRVPQAYRTEINDILLTALVLAIGDWAGSYSLSLFLEGHGRENIIQDIDLSRTIGWFTSIFPLYLEVEEPSDLGEAIKTVKESLRRIPHKGIGYGILAYLTQEPTFSKYAHPTVSFNYLGQWDNTLMSEGVFTFSEESTGSSVSDQNVDPHLLNINAEVKQGVLDFIWSYSGNHYRSETMEKAAHAFIERLKQLIQHCSHDDTFGYTASDFKLANLNEINIINQLINTNE